MILVTGNQGYIGTVLCSLLLDKGYEVVGLDNGYYSQCTLENVKKNFKQIKKDIRNIDKVDLKNITNIIHLAALSNDPLGELSHSLTEKINFEGTVNIAKLAKENNVKRFIFASSQSMYGVSKDKNEIDEHLSKKNPVTSYAKTKLNAEIEINKLFDDKYTVVNFRPSTVFGVSSRLRCDIVFNNLVASAYLSGKIKINTDGSPWRPVVHIQDVCKALIAGIEAPSNLVNGQTFNVGIKNGNYTVKDLAIAAQKNVPGSKLEFLNNETDPRTYRVSFDRIFSVLGSYYKPQWDLNKGAKELINFFEKIKFKEEQFNGKTCNRLKQLKYLIDNGKINNNLNWL